MRKIITYLLVLLGIVLIIVVLPGLIVAIKNFHTTNTVILFVDIIILIGLLFPINIGINLIVNK